MLSRICVVIGLCTLNVWMARLSNAIDITPSVHGGPDPQTLAEMIADGIDVKVVLGSANTTINTGGGTGPNSDPLAMGSFTNGQTAAGTLLPSANQNASNDAVYAGGIDAEFGVCLCTGLVSDSIVAGIPGRGRGLEGPNNGLGGEMHPGEISRTLGTPVDQDFTIATGLPGVGDATVLQFEVEITSPGFMRCSFIFGSDEHPFYVISDSVFNDSLAIFIDNENIATITDNSVVEAFNLFKVSECDQLFVENDVAPSPRELVGSLHSIPGAPFYDIELGGYTKLLTRETSEVLSPGVYTVKVVIQDVGTDSDIDAGMFIPNSGLQLFSFLAADFDLDGDVDSADAAILFANVDGQPGHPFTDGDADGDGFVNTADVAILFAAFGQSGGNANFCADFDRDGAVSGADFLIWQQNVGLEQCASRFEGDADGDGDVDSCDKSIYDVEFSGGSIGGLDCSCAQSATAGSGGGALTAGVVEHENIGTSTDTPTGQPIDIDEDGDVDADDIKQWIDVLSKQQ